MSLHALEPLSSLWPLFCAFEDEVEMTDEH